MTAAVALTYDDTLSRVRVTATGLSGTATTALVERSTDQIRWTTVRGGGAAVVSSGALVRPVDDYEFTADVVNFYRVTASTSGGSQTDQVTEDITPELDSIWLKSVARPFLNRPVTVTDYSDITRPSRTSTFGVVGRTLPIAVSDVRGGRQWTMEVQVQASAAGFGTFDVLSTGESMTAATLDTILASGDVMFVHVPSDCAVPGGYVAIGDVTEARRSVRASKRYFSLPCTEVAAPGPDVVGATSTWQTVLDTYATWGDLIASNATWGDVLELVGNPTEVVVS